MADTKSPYGFRYIGAKRRTKEDPRFVTGRGRYAADIALPGLKHVAIIASPYPSARIHKINTDAARAASGAGRLLPALALLQPFPPAFQRGAFRRNESRDGPGELGPFGQIVRRNAGHDGRLRRHGDPEGVA